MDDVLQSTTVFTNLSKGIVASEKELQENFGTSDLEEVCKIILARGVLQVGVKERERDYDTLWRDVANILAEKCINPDTKRPYTSGVLQKAMKDTGASLDLRRPAKVSETKQASCAQRTHTLLDRGEQRNMMCASIHV